MFSEKKAPKPIGIGASWGEGREERTRNQNVQALSSKASTIRPVAKRSAGSAGSIATCRRRATNPKRSTALRRKKPKKGTYKVSARKGFFTDTTLCIGCKACEVACKQWNQLPDDGFQLTGMSYDNTVHLGAATWRHVAFIERPLALSAQDAGAFSWLFSSDVCKHCARAG